MDLFNTQTRKLDPIDDPDQLHQALLTGTHSFKAGSAIPVTSPTGEPGTIPGDNIQAAIQAGYKVLTPSQQAIQDYVQSKKGIKGSLEVGLTQFADEAALGIPELVYEKKADPLEVAKREALKKDHELSNILGGVGGFGASLLVGGPLFKGAAKVGEKATEAVAAKLGARVAGEEIGARTVKSAAKDIVNNMLSKGAGAAAEGAVVTAPHAITEAALGDPGDAAETLVAGVGIGALLGGGGALAKDAFKLAGEVPSLIAGQKETAEQIARKVARVTTGLHENDTLHYMNNMERVNNAESKEALKDALDSIHSNARSQVDLAEQALADSKGTLSESYHSAKFDLARTKPPKELADEMLGALENQKAVIGGMSRDADAILDATQGYVKKDNLVKMIDTVIDAAKIGEDKALIGEAAKSAVNRMETLKADIVNGFKSDEIALKDTRDILKRVREDTGFGQSAGEFNSSLERMQKSFGHEVSTLLKDSSPDYAKKMQLMSELSDNLAYMSKNFGTKDKATGALNSIFKATGTTKNEALERFSALTGEDWHGKLAEFKKANELYELSKRQDIRKELLPELSKKHEDAKIALSKAQEEFDKVRKLTPEHTRTIVDRKSRLEGFYPDDIKTLKAASDMAGKDFETAIRDRHVLDAFDKASIQGTRKVGLFGAIGAAVGGPTGAAIGAGIGATMDVYGGQIFKKIIDSNKNVAGLLFVEKAMKRVGESLDDIPKALERMGSKSLPPPRPPATLALTRLLTGQADETNKKGMSANDRAKELIKLNEKTGTLVGNPQATASKIALLQSPFRELGAPQIGDAFSAKMNNALNYLHTVMPKPPNPTSPFAPKIEWKPTDAEMSAFEQKVQVIQHPMSVINELEHGTLTKNHMEALKQVYPGIHRMMQQKVQQSVIHGVKPMEYGKRVKLSLLMDAPMDVSMAPESIGYYQKFYAQDASGGAEAPEQPASNNKPGFKAEVDIAGNYATDTDRRESRAKSS